jgi:tetratricopeptide (TPR) repeat protein
VENAMQELLATAIELHQTGQTTSAARLYSQVLEQEHENPDALHLLGVVRHQEGDHARAVELIGRAVAIRPGVPAFHANLAEAYRSQEQFERAVGCCRMAILLAPRYPEAYCNLGLALQGLSRHAEAAEEFRKAIELRADFASAHSNLGISLRELNQFDAALIHFRRAVELDPKFAAALTNLSQILLDRGQPDEALPHCQEAVRLQPDVAALHHNLGNVLRALGKLVDARAAYLEAIRLDPKLSKSYAHIGLALQAEGERGEALTWLRQAVELDPNDATSWESLAELYVAREEPAEAIPCWERALALAPDRASLHNGLGWVLQDVGRAGEAAEHYQTALKLQPDFALAQLHLGGLHEESGELADAEAAFRAALRLQAPFAMPHARLATLLRGKLPDADLAALEERLADPELGEGPRARLLFGLAHALDGRGAYARAAESLRQANALTLEHNRRDKRDYQPAEHERFVENFLETFGPEWFKRVAGTGLDTRRPIFVFGLPRSGTTLLEQILASHSEVYGGGELRLARQTFEAVPSVLGRSEGPLPCVSHLTRDAIRALATKHLEELAALDGARAERVVDKMPDNYMYVGFLAALFPRATFINCSRDLRDVALSCWMTDFRSIRWAFDQEHITSRILQYRRLMDHWKSVLPITVHEVAYEDVVADFEETVRRLLSACGLDWESACLEFHRTRRPIRTASVAQVRQPIYKRSVERWKSYAKELAGLFEGLPLDQTVIDPRA